MLVYVINKNGNRLMPCKPAKARKLLRDGKAHVVCRDPFTIQLNWDCEENVQDITLGIDKGSRVTGFCCVGNGQILMSGEINHRIDIKKKMDGRRQNRKHRRSRKWHRPSRFNNRASSKRSGRLPPSVKANAEEVIRVARKIPLPISDIVIEDVQIDMDKIHALSLHNKECQESSGANENLRMATLRRDGYKCTQCGASKCGLRAHHIVWKSNGGKNSLDNLITLCIKCHKDVHSGKITIRGGVDGFVGRVAQRTMQGKAYLYSELGKMASVNKVFGYQTSEYRKSLNLLKSHDADALCIATILAGEVVPYNRNNFFGVRFRPTQNRRQFYDLPRRGKGRVRYQVNKELEGFKKGDVVLVKDRWIKYITIIRSRGRIGFPLVRGEPGSALPKDCKLLRKAHTVMWSRQLPVLVS